MVMAGAEIPGAPGPPFDVAVIGGGPAGMMAAGRAAEFCANVVLLEANPRPGRKLLSTGNGRCNLTHAGEDARTLAGRFGANGRFLMSAFSVFGVDATLAFFASLGLRTKSEDGGRVFPETDRAADVLGVLRRYMARGGVTVMSGARVTGLDADGGRVVRARLADGTAVHASTFIVCTGGLSYPKTGSDGAGFGWLRALGHTVTPLTPAITPIMVSEDWVRELEGASLGDTTLRLALDGKKKAESRGEVVFTRRGLSGPAALNMGGAAGECIGRGAALLTLDIMPGLDEAALDLRLRDLFEGGRTRTALNCVAGLLTPKLAPVFIRLAGIEPGCQANRISREQRRALVGLIKSMRFTVTGVGGFDRAMVTRGGVSLKELDSKTMRSKLLENIYMAGEVLDLDGPSGGYNLQMCWSTGYVAGGAAGQAASADTTPGPASF